MKPKPTLTAIFTDTHTNSWSALALPVMSMDGGAKEVRTSGKDPSVAWLWDCWQEDLKYLKQRAVGHNLVVCHLGDAIEGDHHESKDHVPDLEDQVDNFVTLFKPVVSMAQDVYWTYGTPAHAGQNGKHEKQICGELGIHNHKSLWKLDLGDGILLEIAHQGPASANTMLQKAINDSSKGGSKLPRFVVRGHRHVVDDTGSRHPLCRAIIAPCWQLRTHYGFQVASQTRGDIGFILIEGENVEIIRHVLPEAPARKVCAN